MTGLDPLKAFDQWVVCEYRPSQTRPGKTDKVPLDPRTGNQSSAHSPTNWLSYEQALEVAQHPLNFPRGVGFVLTGSDPFFCLDIDDCLEPDGSMKPHVQGLLDRFPGAAVEFSYSKRGLHVFGSYQGPPPDHGNKHKPLGIELYTAGQFIALGSDARGDASTNCTVGLHPLAAEFFPPTPSRDAEWTEGPCDEWTGHHHGLEDDETLLERAMKAKSKFGIVQFADLWHARTKVLAEEYPDDTRAFDASSADQALARHLSYWTGRDGSRIERLMLQSKLKRDKWEMRPEYLRGTICNVLSPDVRVYDRPPADLEGDEHGHRSGYQLLPVEGQIALFDGYVYVVNEHKIFTPNGQLLGPQQFNAVMPCHEFIRDTDQKRITTKPWEAFMESLWYKPAQVDDLTWDPTQQLGAILDRDGVKCVNTYRPLDTPRKQGDPTPFVRHVALLLPDESDRQVLLSYLAAMVQFKGVKFRWTILLQGMEGNGKSLVVRVAEQALGERYSYMPRDKDLRDKFNAWVVGSLLVYVEDFYSPGDSRRIWDNLKPMIASTGRLSIRDMMKTGRAQRIYCNFIFTSNYKEAIPLRETSRRCAVLYTAQQTNGDLERYGMTNDYFRGFVAWLEADGFAIAHNFLATYPIPDEFNPVLCARAPKTSAWDEAIEATRDPYYEVIEDAIHAGVPGCMDGWLSRQYVERRIKDAGLPRLRPCLIRPILRSLGYVPHPGLPEHRAQRRTRNFVDPDHCRAELWVHADSPHASLQTCVEVEDAYQQAQGYQCQPTIEN